MKNKKKNKKEELPEYLCKEIAYLSAIAIAKAMTKGLLEDNKKNDYEK